MKFRVLLLLFAISFISLKGQDIKISSGVFPNAGTKTSAQAVNLSKWKIGQVHMLVLESDESNDKGTASWDIKSYPNPFVNSLNIKFDTEKNTEFHIELSDVSGKKHLYRERKMISPNQLVKLDIPNLSSGIYFLSVYPENQKVKKVIKVLKN